MRERTMVTTENIPPVPVEEMMGVGWGVSYGSPYLLGT